MTCTITGYLRDPTGAPVADTPVLITAQAITASADGAMLPRRVEVTTDAAGRLIVDLLPGRYALHWRSPTQQHIVPLSVPDEAAAELADLLVAAPIPVRGPEGPPGPPGAIDFGEVTAATGEPGTDVRYDQDTGTLYIPRGDVGPEGPEGPQGPEGPPGNPGGQGPVGDKGPDGDQGPQGDPGPDGAKGPDGDKGPTGDKGPDGDPGPQGIRGPDGNPGADGAPGADGDRGPQGDPGDKGPDGDPGPQGEPGDKGPAGDKGPVGDKGPDGDPGADGAPGNSVPIASLGEFASAVPDRLLATASVWGALVPLTEAATIAVDLDLGYDFGGPLDEPLLLGANRTLGAPVGARTGKKGILWFSTLGGAVRTLTLDSGWRLAEGVEVGPYEVAAGAVLGVAYACLGTTVIVTGIIKAEA